MKIELSPEHGDKLLEIANAFRRICALCETDLTTAQTEAVEALRDECRSATKAKARAGL